MRLKLLGFTVAATAFVMAASSPPSQAVDKDPCLGLNRVKCLFEKGCSWHADARYYKCQIVQEEKEVKEPRKCRDMKWAGCLIRKDCKWHSDARYFKCQEFVENPLTEEPAKPGEMKDGDVKSHAVESVSGQKDAHIEDGAPTRQDSKTGKSTKIK